jgi:predicted Fe-Mo cluster-binding NifX family protein
MRIAVPSEQPGGLESAISAHFGHCPCFTIVDTADGEVGEVRVLPNMPHGQGGCMAPVMYL